MKQKTVPTSVKSNSVIRIIAISRVTGVKKSSP